MVQPVVICDTCGESLGNPLCGACRRYAAKPVPPVQAKRTPLVPGSGPVQRERRNIDRQRPLLGGERVTDPPLTTRDCADWMGMTTEFIRGAVDEKTLEAEDTVINGRRAIRIHLDDFITYLKRIGWKRLPRRPGEGEHDDQQR
jgi:hypothetical protein